MTFYEARLLITNATKPGDLFPLTDPDAAQKKYRALVIACHPDRAPLEHRDSAEMAMRKLTELYAQLTKPASTKPPRPVLVGKWLVTSPIHKGALTDLYTARHVDRPAEDGVLKIARHGRHNGLMDREAKSLKMIADTIPPGAEKELEPFTRYLPRIVERFDASYRRTNVLTAAQPGSATLEYITRISGGAIGDFRHAVWMVNRCLSALGFMHRAGVMHGAVLPHHLLYHPPTHGLALVDWTASVSTKGHSIPYVVTRYKDLYPIEVLFKKGECHPQTDIYMLFSSIRRAYGGPHQIPHPFRPIFDLCLVESLNSRPSDAWAVQDRWRHAAQMAYGDPKFVELKLAVN